MGDIADMMLDGTLDCVTGEYLGLNTGYPVTFEKGHPDYISQEDAKLFMEPSEDKVWECFSCGKQFNNKHSLGQHRKDKGH